LPATGTEVTKGSTVAIVLSSGPAGKKVPYVADEPLGQAEAQLHKAGFLYSASRQPSAAVKKGWVISTDPIAGSAAAAGSTIQLSVSSGAPLVPLVPVVGDTYSEAYSILRADLFRVKRVNSPSSITPDQVLAESPGTAKAPQGSIVTLTVAEPPTRVEVPPLEGDTEADAQQTLVNDGLTGAPTLQPTLNPQLAGIVISQMPAAGSYVKKGKSITLVIGSYSGSSGNSGTSGASGVTGAT
jgi:serine/threonine-protein kinase